MLMNDQQAIIGIIGGSGLYEIEGFENVSEILVDTPFGTPSDKIVLGTIENVPVAFLARHNRNHTFLPAEVPYQANIYAFKKLGVKYIISVSAVGSLQEECKPLDFVLVDQFIDYTNHRNNTFFSNSGIVAHVPFSNPICEQLSKIIYESSLNAMTPPSNIFPTGTYVAINGPSFSTKAESNVYRKLGATVVGMTVATEAKLAREAEIAYSCICMVTDYDCWNPSHDSVTVELVVKNLHSCIETAKKIIVASVHRLSLNPFVSKAHSSLKNAIASKLNHVPEIQIQRLYEIVKPYLHHLLLPSQ